MSFCGIYTVKYIRLNKYGRTEEYYQCEDCSECPHKQACCKCKGNCIIRLNEELTQFHQEVLIMCFLTAPNQLINSNYSLNQAICLDQINLNSADSGLYHIFFVCTIPYWLQAKSPPAQRHDCNRIVIIL